MYVLPPLLCHAQYDIGMSHTGHAPKHGPQKSPKKIKSKIFGFETLSKENCLISVTVGTKDGLATCEILIEDAMSSFLHAPASIRLSSQTSTVLQEKDEPKIPKSQHLS